MQRAILQTLATHDGRMRIVDIMTELARGVGAMATFKENARELTRQRLVRGPSPALLGYELTDEGWKIIPTLAS